MFKAAISRINASVNHFLSKVEHMVCYKYIRGFSKSCESIRLTIKWNLFIIHIASPQTSFGVRLSRIHFWNTREYIHVCCSLSYTQLCCQKGFFCEICNNSKIIYPFEVVTTTQVRLTAVVSPTLSRFANGPFANAGFAQAWKVLEF